MRLDLRELVTSSRVEALRHEEVDLGPARPPFDAETSASRFMHRAALLVAVPAGHRLAPLRRPVGARDLAGEPVVMHHPLRARYFHDLVISSVPVARDDVVHTVDQVLTVLWLVQAGRGLTFAPASAGELGISP